MNIQPHPMILDQLVWSAVSAGLGIAVGVVLGIVIGVHIAGGRAIESSRAATSSTARPAVAVVRETVREVVREVPVGALDHAGPATGTSVGSRTQAAPLPYPGPAGQLPAGGAR